MYEGLLRIVSLLLDFEASHRKINILAPKRHGPARLEILRILQLCTTSGSKSTKDWCGLQCIGTGFQGRGFFGDSGPKKPDNLGVHLETSISAIYGPFSFKRISNPAVIDMTNRRCSSNVRKLGRFSLSNHTKSWNKSWNREDPDLRA